MSASKPGRRWTEEDRVAPGSEAVATAEAPSSESPGSIRVLVADDEPVLTRLLEDVLRDRTDCVLDTAADGEEALHKLRGRRPDLLITDLKMPRLDGEALAREALAASPDLPVVVITGNATVDSAVRLMKQGVTDYLVKPLRIDDLLSAIDRAIEKVRRGHVRGIDSPIARTILAALEAKDPYLRAHATRVAELTGRLGRAIGLKPAEARLLVWGGLAHDVGKIGISDAILHKPGRLTEDEYRMIREHPMRSVRILEPLPEFRRCLPDVYHHHERYDGTGYPGRLAGNRIPLRARIISVCDAYDAMRNDRSYRSALAPEEARRCLLDGRGTQFDPELVRAFLRTIEDEGTS